MSKNDIEVKIMKCGMGKCKSCGSYKIGKCNWHNMLKEYEDDM